MIYLDNSAGTRPYPEVIETITDVLTNHWGNASADYSFGQDAQEIIDNVAEQVAKDIGCNSEEIIWASGACEANSLAIIGTLQRYCTYLITSNLEHTSINEIIKGFEQFDFDSYFYLLKNDKYGFVSLEDLESKLKHKKKYDDWHKTLVSISFANSEVGTIQDIKAISNIVHKYNGYLHVDATQMYPWMRFSVKDLGIDMMSVSGQKLHCCKGIGFLYVKNGIELNTLIYGSQQRGIRGGTYPTHLIAAFGKALEITRQQNGNVFKLRNKLLQKLLTIQNVKLNGPSITTGITTCNRLPNNINLTIDGVSAEALVAMCDEQGIMIAKGSACQSYNPVPSKTLLAIGLTEEEALSTIRISLDEFNTEEEIDYVCEILPKIIARLRAI